MNCEGVKEEGRAEVVFTDSLPFSGTQRPCPELLSHSLSITTRAGGQCGSLPHTAAPFNSLSWRQQTGLDKYVVCCFVLFSCTHCQIHKGFTFCIRPVDHLAWFKKMARLQRPIMEHEEITISVPGLCSYTGNLLYPEKHYFSVPQFSRKYYSPVFVCWKKALTRYLKEIYVIGHN